MNLQFTFAFDLSLAFAFKCTSPQFEHKPGYCITLFFHKITSLRQLLASVCLDDRYNDFTHDPLSRCNCTPPYSGENAISARCDLNPAAGKYPFGALGHRNHGGIDMKVGKLQHRYIKYNQPFGLHSLVTKNN